MSDSDPTSDWMCETCGARVELNDVGRPRSHWKRQESGTSAEPAVRCPTSGARRVRDVILRAPDTKPKQMKRPGNEGEVDGQGKLFK
jgi:hypothetical protein